MDLSCSGEDGKVLGEAVDDKKEDGGGGDDEQQPLLVPLPVLGRDHSGADGDEEAGFKAKLAVQVQSLDVWREGLPGRDRVLVDVKLKQFLFRISLKLNE